MGQTLTRTLTPFDCNKCQMMMISLSFFYQFQNAPIILLLWTKQSVCIPNFRFFSFRLYSPPICTFFFTFPYWSSCRVFSIFSSVFTSFLYLYICQTTPRIPPKGPTHIFPSTSRICILILKLKAMWIKENIWVAEYNVLDSKLGLFWGHPYLHQTVCFGKKARQCALQKSQRKACYKRKLYPKPTCLFFCEWSCSFTQCLLRGLIRTPPFLHVTWTNAFQSLYFSSSPSSSSSSLLSHQSQLLVWMNDVINIDNFHCSFGKFDPCP